MLPTPLAPLRGFVWRRGNAASAAEDDRLPGARHIAPKTTANTSANPMIVFLVYKTRSSRESEYG